MLHRFVNPDTLLIEINDLLGSSYTNVIDGSLALLQSLTGSTLTNLDALVNLWLVDLTGQTGPTEDLFALYLETTGPLEDAAQSALEAHTLFTAVTDIFNLLQNTGYTYTGGALTVTDHEGTLVTSPANTAGFEGGRLTDGVWYDTDLDGNPLQPSVNLPTKAGTREWYTEPFDGPFGYSNWPARTNKVTCRKYNPVDTTNISDSSGVLSVTDSTASLTAAGLLGVCSFGDVYRSDNSAGVGNVTHDIEGVTGNINAHSLSVYARIVSGNSGNSKLRIGNGAAGSIGITGEAFTRFLLPNVIPANSVQKMVIVTGIGDVVEFILPQLEEGAFVSPPIFDTEEDTLTSITRQATELDEPLEEVGTQLQLVVIPAATDTAGTLLDDGTNKLSYDGANLIFTDGTTTLSAAATLTAGETYTIGVKGLAGDWALSLDTVDIDTDATSSVVAWTPASVRLGRDAADSDHFAGYFPNIAGFDGTDATWYKTALGD
jgi:hypothetical protein